MGNVHAVPLNHLVFIPISAGIFGVVRRQMNKACCKGQVSFVLSVRVRSWPSSFCNYTWTWPRLGRRLARHWLKISSPSLSPCVNSSLLSAPSSPPFHIKLFFPPQHHLPSDTCSISFSPFKPQPSSIHLLLSSAPYPSCSTFVAVTDCRD